MAAGRTYTPIATQTISTTTGQVTFSNIPQTYTDLILIINGRDAYVGTSPFMSQINIRVNGDSTSIYSDTVLYGTGSSAASSRTTNVSYATPLQMPNSAVSASIFGANILQILNYANTTTYKTMIGRSAADSNGQGWAWSAVSLWRSTAAISSINLYGGSTGFVAGSTFTLYGIAAA